MDLKSTLWLRQWALDGALGTELENKIAPDSPIQPKLSPLWSGMVLLHQPHLVQLVHLDYLRAGAQLLMTSTYQALELSLRKFASLDTPDILNLWNTAVSVCAEAIYQFHASTQDPFPIPIIGSIGPYATLLADGLEYTGEYKSASEHDIRLYYTLLVEFYRGHRQVKTVFFETVPNMTEVKVILQYMAAHDDSLEFFLSLNIRDKDTLADGTLLQDVVQYVEGAIDKSPVLQKCFLGLGLNCIDYRKVPPALDTINACLTRPMALAVYPNFEFYYKSDVKGSKMMDEWEREVAAWLAIPNVRIVGGCCGTTPDDISAIRRVMAANRR